MTGPMNPAELIAAAVALFVVMVFSAPYLVRYSPLEHIVLLAAAVERTAFRVRSAAQQQLKKNRNA
jgi:hypothetical protein